MRVATIFTGVAACTVGWTQIANADATHPAATNATAHIARALHPERASYGSIRYSTNCGNQNIDKTWLHVSTNNATPISPYISYCFGYFGLYNSPPGIGINYECGGNNHGLLVGVTADGDKWSTGFGPGTTYRKLDEAHLYGIFINSWTGDDECGKPPNWSD